MGADDAGKVGGRIKQLREERRLSLRVLSRKSGVSANALSLIERNRTSPTVTTLIAIASAFNVPLNDFFTGLNKEKPGFVVYKGSAGHKNGAVEALATNLKGQNLNPLLIRLSPEEKSRKDVHSGDEFVYCLSGAIECEIQGSTIRLNPGDAVTYKAEIPHRLKSVSPFGSDVLVVFEIGRAV